MITVATTNRVVCDESIYPQGRYMVSNARFYTERLFAHSPSAVYDAFENPEKLEQWWGPDGFCNVFEAFDFNVDGRWVFEMHGPDGKRYPNTCRFVALEPATTIVIAHDCPPFFTLSIGLSEEGGWTRLTWEQVFEDAAFAQAVRHIVEPANEQNLDRLTRILDKHCAR